MRKIKAALIALLMAVVLATPLALASPAHAACFVRERSDSVTVKAIEADGQTVGSYTLTGTLEYSACDTFAWFHRYKVRISENWGQCGLVQSFKVNPNAIAGWDPGTKQAYCQDSDEVDVLTFDPGDSRKVYPYNSDAYSCIGANVQVDLNANPDWLVKIPARCVSF